MAPPELLVESAAREQLLVRAGADDHRADLGPGPHPVERDLRRGDIAVGGDVPSNEYDTYIKTVRKLFARGANAREIAARLLQIQTVSIGISDTKNGRERIERAAASLAALNTRREARGRATPPQSRSGEASP